MIAIRQNIKEEIERRIQIYKTISAPLVEMLRIRLIYDPVKYVAKDGTLEQVFSDEVLVLKKQLEELAKSFNYKMQADFNGELYGRIGRVGDFVAVPG